MVQKGHVICFRDAIMPASEIFEAEIELLELLDFKPIFSRGYQCMLHMHTFADDCSIKDILVAYEKDPTGQIITKENPKFTRSFSTIRARVTTRVPIPSASSASRAFSAISTSDPVAIRIACGLAEASTIT